MKTTLVKKLLKFIIPLLTIPMILMLVFYHSYLMHIIKAENINLTKNSISQFNTIMQKNLNNQSDLSEYLIKPNANNQYPLMLIIDKNLNIIADVNKDNIGKRYEKHNKIIKRYIKEVLDKKTLDTFSHEEIQLVIKPLLNSDNKIMAFTIGNYKNIFNKKTAIINQTFFYIIFIIILTLFISIIFIIIFSYSLTYPITLLIDATKNIAKGDVSHKIDISSNDEIGILITSFNDMAQKQKLMNDEIINLNSNLEFRIKEEVEKNRLKEQQLIQQSRMAQMGEMLSMIAHQWRQPLAAISATSATIEMKAHMNKLDNNTAQEKAQDISHFSQHLSKTIDDFRNFFKPDKLKEETTFSEVMESSLKIVQTELEAKNILVQTDYQCKGTLFVYVNELRQVALNLIKNAEDALLENKIKNPTITIICYSDKNNGFLEIQDNAGGIDDTIIHKIFDPYFSTKKDKEGTGLGLYMSKVIIEEHCSGKLSVQNSKDGAVFKVTLNKRKGKDEND